MPAIRPPRRVRPAMRAAVLEWYGARGRVFPFRATTDPYAVLVSEVMAQQTQIARAAEAWLRFVARFPTFEALAAAPTADVLREWRGLGYNRRALNLQRAARVVVEEHGGRLPADLAALGRLPGVGPYTARAVAAIAFGQPVGAVDTNVRRVLGRAVAGDAALAPALLQAVADAAVPRQRPGDWTHALMDVGATFCRPLRPRCGDCPVRPWCRFAAAAAGIGGGRSARPRRADPRFASTSRWLRGRILDRLRDAPAGEWTAIRETIGSHDVGAVSRAVAALALDGLAELHPTDPTLARLPGA